MKSNDHFIQCIAEVLKKDVKYVSCTKKDTLFDKIKRIFKKY